jgi:hypothetical protein
MGGDLWETGVSAHKTIAVIGEYLIREVVAISELNWNAVNQLREWQEGDSLPFAPARVAECWQDVYRRLHVSKEIDAAFDESRKAFWQLAPEAARAADISQTSWADETVDAPDRGGG